MKLLGKPTHAIVHHSLTADGKMVNSRAIRKFHSEHPHLYGPTIGYHATVELVDYMYEAFYGRPWEWQGAHCREHSMNRKAMGICIVGNFDHQPPAVEAYEVAAGVIATWMRMFEIPMENVNPHRMYAPHKSCPGKLFSMDKLYERIEHVMTKGSNYVRPF